MDRDKLIEAITKIANNQRIGVVINCMDYGTRNIDRLADALLPLITAEVTAQKYKADIAEKALVVAAEAFYCLVNDKEESNEKTVNQLVEYFKEQALNG